MIVTYDSSNSGGGYWLDKREWDALVAAGWKITRMTYTGKEPGAAEKEFDSIDDAIMEFENLTSQIASDPGCPCCGPPHNFSSDTGDYYDGHEEYSEDDF